jgi:hypothetical protein
VNQIGLQLKAVHADRDAVRHIAMQHSHLFWQ